jgi:hypothetical protein
VTPDLAHGLDDLLADLLREGLQLIVGQRMKVLGLADALQKL